MNKEMARLTVESVMREFKLDECPGKQFFWKSKIPEARSCYQYITHNYSISTFCEEYNIPYSSQKAFKKVCPKCGTEFEGHNPMARYCSAECKLKAKAESRERNKAKHKEESGKGVYPTWDFTKNKPILVKGRKCPRCGRELPVDSLLKYCAEICTEQARRRVQEITLPSDIEVTPTECRVDVDSIMAEIRAVNEARARSKE